MPDEKLTSQERTLSYILNPLSGVFQASKAGLHNVELFVYANPLDGMDAQKSLDLLGKQGVELVEIVEQGKAWLLRIRAFLQAAETEVTAAQPASTKAAELAASVKTMAADDGARIVDQKPVAVEVVKNLDGTITVSAKAEEVK